VTVGSVVADSAVMFQRVARRSLRNRDTLVVSLSMPILIMALFVYVFGGAIEVGMRYIDYVIPGIILLCTGFGASITATGVATDMTAGALDRFRTLPVYRQALLTGHAVEGVARNLAAVTVVFVVAFAFGFRPEAGIAAWLAVLALIAVFVHAITWLSVAMGLLADSPEAAGGFTYAIMFIPYVSSAFVDPRTMPGWLRGFADNQPATPVIDTVRGLLIGDAPDRMVGALVWSVALTIVGYLFAAILFERRCRE